MPHGPQPPSLREAPLSIVAAEDIICFFEVIRIAFRASRFCIHAEMTAAFAFTRNTVDDFIVVLFGKRVSGIVFLNELVVLAGRHAIGTP